MKRLNRKRLIEDFESARNGVWQAHMAFAEHGDKTAMACMRAHHGNLNQAIAELGGAAVELADLESIVSQQST